MMTEREPLNASVPDWMSRLWRSMLRPFDAETWLVVNPATRNAVAYYDSEGEATGSATWYEANFGKALEVHRFPFPCFVQQPESLLKRTLCAGGEEA